MQGPQLERQARLVVLGGGGVGKTALVSRFVGGAFPDAHAPTLEDMHQRTLRMPDGAFRRVSILDTGGCGEFPAMRELAIRGGGGFVLVFALDSPDSFREALRLRDDVTRIKGEEAPVVLAGNKADLPRALMEDGRRYIETSAKANLNIAHLFRTVLALAEGGREPIPSRRRRLSSLTDLALLRRRCMGTTVL